MFFAQRSCPDDFTNGVPGRFPMSELTGLTENVRHNKPLYSVTLPDRWYFKNKGIFGYNKQGNNNTWLGKQFHTARILTNIGQYRGVFVGAATPPRVPDPYTTTYGVKT